MKCNTGVLLALYSLRLAPIMFLGACIVNVENKIVGIGYNGMPNGCSDDVLPWTREGAWLETKYPYGTCVTPCCDTLHREARLHACLCCVGREGGREGGRDGTCMFCLGELMLLIA